MNTPVGLAAEDAAVYGYGLLLASVDSAYIGAVQRELAAHRVRRDTAEVLWPDSPPAPVGYLSGPETPRNPVEFAARIEADCCDAWRVELGIATDPDVREFCLEALTSAAIQLARWRTQIPDSQFEALPGFPPSA